MVDYREADIRLMTKNLVEAYMEILSAGYAVSVQDFLAFRNYACLALKSVPSDKKPQPEMSETGQPVRQTYKTVNETRQKTREKMNQPVTFSQATASPSPNRVDGTGTNRKSDYEILKGVKDEWN